MQGYWEKQDVIMNIAGDTNHKATLPFIEESNILKTTKLIQKVPLRYETWHFSECVSWNEGTFYKLQTEKSDVINKYNYREIILSKLRKLDT